MSETGVDSFLVGEVVAFGSLGDAGFQCALDCVSSEIVGAIGVAGGKEDLGFGQPRASEMLQVGAVHDDYRISREPRRSASAAFLRIAASVEVRQFCGARIGTGTMSLGDFEHFVASLPAEEKDAGFASRVHPIVTSTNFAFSGSGISDGSI